MKTIARRYRVLAAFLVLVMMLGLLSGISGRETANAKTKDQILYYQAQRTMYPFGTGFSCLVTINVKLNRTKKTAEIDFIRSNCEADWKHLKESFPERAKSLRKFVNEYTGTYHCTTNQITWDEYDSGNKTAFILKGFKWTTEKFDFFGSGTYAGDYIKINGWNKVLVGGLGSGSVGYEGGNGSQDFFFKKLDGPPKKIKTDYKIKQDNFKFVNEGSAFFKKGTTSKSVKEKIFRDNKFANGTGGFLLDNTSYEALLKGLDNSKVAAINVMLSGRWGGCCLGMSVMSGLLYEGKIGMKKVGGASNVYGLKSPAEGNTQLSGYIEYYHLLGNFNRKRFYYLNKDNYPASRDSAKGLVQMLEEKPMNPVVVGFHWTTNTNGKKVYHGHAVLAFRVEDDTEGYKIAVYDPNSPKEERYIIVTEDGDASFAKYSSKITLQPPKRAIDLYNTKLVYPDIPEGYVVVRSDGDVTLKVDGKTTSIEGDEIVGDLEVYAEREEGGDVVTILVPAGTEFTIRRRGGKNASVQTGDTTALITDGANELTMGPDGTVTAKTTGKKGSLAVASDKTKGDLFGITAETDAGTVSITPANDGAHVETDTGKTDITVSGAKDGVTFEGVDATGGVDIKTNGKKAKIYAGDKEIGSGEAKDQAGDDDGKGDDTGKTDTDKPKNNPNLKIKKDNEKTGYTPDGWKPINSKKSSVKYFIPGKYVREDGMAVMYIKSKKGKSFYFQLYQMAIGAHQDAYLINDTEKKDRFLKATIKSATVAVVKEDSLTFKARKNGSIKVTSDWIDEMYIQFDAPDGIYYLVKEN